jgi:integrase
MRISLTDLAVKNLASPARGQATYLDKMIPGFGVRVSQGGAKSFVLVSGPHRRRTTLGRYPIVSLAKAREKARDILAEQQLGIHHEAPRLTFEQAYELFSAAYAAKNRPKTVYEMERIVKRHLMPAFRRYPLIDITADAIAAIIRKLRATPAERQSAYVAMRTIFRWFVRRKFIKASPVAEIDAPTVPPSRDRVLTDTELVEIYRTAVAEDSIFGKIVQLLVLTGQRKGQFTYLRREYVDDRANLITWPTSVMKAKRAHSIPLTDATKAIIATLPKEGYLFRARGKDSPYNGYSVGKERFDEKLEGVQPWTLHDLRRTFATGLARLRVPPHIKEMLLAHASAKDPVEAIYDRWTYESEIREAMQRWETHLQTLLSNTENTNNGRDLSGLHSKRAVAAE